MVKLYESDDFFFLLTVILFLVINFEPKVSQLYLGMALIGAWAYSEVTRKKLFAVPPLKKESTSWTTGILYGVAFFAIFIFVTPIILNTLGFPEYNSPQSVLELMSTGFSTKPVLEQSKITSFFMWGWLIPYVETIFFSVMMLLWIATKYHYSLTKLKDQIILMTIVGIAAMLFHMTAKGITNNAALITTFIFFFMNSYLVIKFREKIQAAVMHITGNSIAINQILGIWKLKIFGLG